MAKKDIKLLPCPVCGSSVEIEGGDQWHNQNRFFICCNKKGCGVITLGDTVKEECIRRWNALPRTLHWTTEKPTKTGWYWGRLSEKFLLMIYVNDDICYIAGEDEDTDLEILDDIEWAGPIPLPKVLEEESANEGYCQSN